MPVAIGAFFALDVIIIAFVLMLWVLATAWMIRPVILFLANAVSDFPAFGGWLSDELRDLESYINNWITNTIRSAYNAGATPIIRIMDTYANAHSGDMYSQRVLAYNMVTSIVETHDVAHNQVNSPTQTFVNNNSSVNNTYVIANTDAAVTQSENYTQSVYGGLADWAYAAVISVYNDVVDADNRIAAQATQEASDITAANGYAQSVGQYAEDNAVVRANDYTGAKVAESVDYTTQVRDYATAINADTRTWTEGQIGTQIRGVEQLLTAGITAVLTTVTVLANDYADFKKNCGDPLCDGLLGFAKEMSAIKGLVTTGLLIGFLASAIANPEGTADATVAVIDGITSPAKALFGEFLQG